MAGRRLAASLAALLMAITYVGGAVASSAGNTDVSVDLTALTGGSDTAPSPGDLVIFAFNIADADNADLDLVCNTAGFDTQEIADLFGNGTQDANLAVFWKIMGATPDAAVVGEGSTGGNDTAILAAAMVFRGVDPTSPFDVAATTATGTTGGLPDPPSIDTTGAAGIWTVIVGANAHAAGAGGAFTGPTGYTTDFLTIGNVNDTADGIIGMGYKTTPSDPENPGAFADNVAATGWCAVTMALRPAPAVATGTLAATDAVDAAAAAGEVVVEGGLAGTDAADVAAMAGDVPVAGSFAVTEGTPDVAALSGDVLVAGDLAATEAADACAAEGNVEDSGISGEFAATEGVDTAAAAGEVLVEGQVAATEAADVAALAGDVPVVGTLAPAEGTDVAALDGGVLVSGAMAAAEASDTSALSGEVPTIGALDATEALDVAMFTSQGVATGNLASTESADVCAGSGAVLVEGAAAATEAADAAAIAGDVLVSAAFALVEAADGVLAAGAVLVEGALASTEAPDTLAVTQDAPWGSTVPPNAHSRARLSPSVTRAR